MFKNQAHKTFSFLFTAGFFIAVHAHGGPTRTTATMDEPSHLTWGMTHRSVLQAGAPHCFRARLPAAGLAMLDLTVPLTTDVEPRLGLLTNPQHVGDAPSVIDRTATSLLLAGGPGTEFVVCAGPQDPRQALGEYRLRSAFQEMDKSQEIEVEPDGLKSEEIEVEPDGLNVSAALLADLCRPTADDDHGDAFLCATPLALGQAVQGTLHNSWGDDHDLFAFQLDQMRTVRITTAGTGPLSGGLVSERGMRLAVQAAQENFQLVKTLEPGLYFVRIGGKGEAQQGAYKLRVEILELAW